MAVATPYCTLEDMQRLFSSQGVTAFSDHDADGQDDDGVTDDCIDQATEEINYYAMQFYSAASLAASTLINRWCTVLAVVFLCQRRGNPIPDSLASEREAIIAKLIEIRSGIGKLPGVAYKSNLRPSFSNLEIDRRFPSSRVRVNRTNSDGVATTLTQKAVGDSPIETFP